MIDVFFDELQKAVITGLTNAKGKVKIAVAWINFEVYKKVFEDLLKRQVKLKIVINDDFINSRYNSIIDELRAKGAKIKKFSMATKKQYMHEKFMIIDSQIVFFGSYNWSKNANKNFEYLAVCNEINMVSKFKYEFKCIWELSREDIINLQKPQICDNCGCQIHNIGVISQEGYYQTKFELYRNCGCGTYNEGCTDFYDGSVYATIEGIYEQFDNCREYAFNCGIDFDEKEEERSRQEMDGQIKGYLSGLRHSGGSFQVHAVGVYANNDCKYGDGGYYINILWKDKFIAGHIEDWYDIY